MFALQDLGQEGESKGKLIKNLQKPDMSCFSPREHKMLEELALTYKNSSASEISEISHLKNQPWELTLRTSGEKSLIDYLTALKDKSEEEKDLAQEKLNEYFAIIQNFNYQF
jgi:uncharacterized phage-associated protein